MNGSRDRPEPWRPFEAKVDPDGLLPPTVRARRARNAYRAHMRAIARKSVKARAATKARKDAADARALARPPSPKQLADFRREMREMVEARIILAASQRAEKGIADLRSRQLERRDDCILCHRPFTDEERAIGLTPAGRRRRERWLSVGAGTPP